MSDKKSDPAPTAPAASGGGGIKAMLPAIVAIVVAPLATFGVAQFVLLPKFEASLHSALSAEPGAAEAGAAHGEPAKAEESGGHGAAKAESSGGHGGKAAATAADGSSYRFENVVVNLAGTMGTRYLKTSFLVTGDKADVVAKFEAAKAQLGDVTLGILSGVTLADLEEPGSKNVLRERLLAAYNQALGGRVVSNLYFSEFVVQ